MDIWVIWEPLLDVVQATGVWFQDGRVMEHLVESDAQEDHVELREGESDRKRERKRNEACVIPVSLPFIFNQGTL